MSEKRHAALGIHNSDESHEHHHPHRGAIMKRAKFVGASILALMLLGAIANVAMRVVHARALEKSTAEEGHIYVSTANPKPAGDTLPITLPGTLQGIIESPIYARSSGYVLNWKTDIGAHVHKGDVLAEIDAPEVNEQLSQAVATSQQAASSLELAKSSAERWEALRKKDAVTQQELDERSSAYTQAKANLAAAQANVTRLQKLKDFEKVIAPFDGVVTHRYIDVGDLIDAGNGGAGRALFTLSQVDPLRVYIYVPQTYSDRIKVGDKVKVTQAELAGQTFTGTVARTAGAIDAATRTLQVEINLPNHDEKLLAGAYVQVALPINSASSILIVPANVILFRPQGTQIAVMDDTGHIKLHTVSIGHDLGNTLEILSGISATDKLVLNPPDSLADNDVVTVAQPKEAEPAKKAAL